MSNQISSHSRPRSPVASRPTTPLRPSSRSSFRASTGPSGSNPLDDLEPQFAELADSMADLEANLMHLQLMNESLSRFGENFAGFLYGLNMNAFVVDFPEAPILESIKRWQRRQVSAPGQGSLLDQSAYFPSNTNTGNSQSETNVGDATFTTNPDASFASLKATPRRKSLAPPVTPATSTAPQRGLPGAARGGGAGRGRGRGGTAGGGARGSALPRGRGRGGK